jgi:predicted amidohydrolase
MKIACLQTNPQGDVEQNFAQVVRLCGEAAQQGAELIVLPEMFAYMGPDQGRLQIASSLDEGIFARIRKLAQDLGVTIVGGSHPETSSVPNRVFNTALTVDASGKDVSVYRKIHLFNLWGANGEKLFCEADTFQPGDSVAGCQLSISGTSWRTLVGVCYDLRFPEFFRSRDAQDSPYDLVILPAAFTHATGQAHWETLLRARAIENQCYVVACNQTGFFQNGSKRNFGHSMVISPWGEVVAALQEEEGLLFAELKKEELVTVRNKLPALRNRVLI